MNHSFKVSIVLPAFNEEANIRPIVDKFKEVLGGIDYELVFVDDGSSDQTLSILKQLKLSDPRIRFLSFSRNFGHQNALKAGLDHARGDCLIFIDCDLQHPPSLISKMLELWQAGNEVVYTTRKDSVQTSFFKRVTAAIFYKILNLLSDIPIAQGRADFFLIDRKVADVLKNYNESPLFFRGMLPWIGFKQEGISYTPQPRFSGKTKYSLKRMIEFAIDGITSFSIKPLRISIFCGISFSVSAFMYLAYIFYLKMFTDLTVSGWTSILGCVLLMGGIQLIMLGIIGEYLGKLFMQSKGRPIYLIREKSEDA